MTANYLHELRTHGEIKVSRREVSNPWTITSPAATVNPMFRFLAPCLILLLFGCSTTRKRNPDEAQAPIIPAPYARVSQTESNLLQLEIAARMFVPAKKHRPVIWLTGVSHLGDQEYYDALQQHLDKVDLVLFEGIGDSRREDKSSHSGAKPAAQKPNDDPPEDLSSRHALGRGQDDRCYWSDGRPAFWRPQGGARQSRTGLHRPELPRAGLRSAGAQPGRLAVRRRADGPLAARASTDADDARCRRRDGSVRRRWRRHALLHCRHRPTARKHRCCSLSTALLRRARSRRWCTASPPSTRV